MRRFSLSVTELAAFCCRTGSIEPSSFNQSTVTLQQGQEGQKIVQSNRGPNYKTEIPVSRELATHLCTWKLSGRIDGIETAPQFKIEEIKTTGHSQQTLPESSQLLHLAQAKLYAAIVADENQLKEILVCVTYFQLPEQEEYQFNHHYSQHELSDFLHQCIHQYSEWLDLYCQYLDERNISLGKLSFPFEDYREGQRQLSVQTYRDIRDGQQAIYHAPTGLGKTTALLFPALKALQEGQINQIWYITAKTSGQNSVNQSLAQLEQQKPNLRMIRLVAKEKQCLCNTQDLQQNTICTLQQDYYQRLPKARTEFQNSRYFSEQSFYDLANQHQLCPHQLSRDLMPWADLIIADYNYVFDPFSRLADYFNKNKRISLLVDEAHNLPTRARDMFSETLAISTLRSIKQEVNNPALSSRIQRSITKLKTLLQNQPLSIPEESFTLHLQETLQRLFDWFQQQNWLLFPSELFENIMTVMAFSQRLLNVSDEDRFITNEKKTSLSIVCVDPAPRLQEISDTFKSAHYFSGSLLPLHFFSRELRRDAFHNQLVLDSPFPPQHLCSLIYPLNTRYQQRQESIPHITSLLEQVWSNKPGRYLVTFPSYEYMSLAHQHLIQNVSRLPVQQQPQTHDAEAREAFLHCLSDKHIIALAISGGLFAEGLDLQDNKLDGVIIIGTCLPPPSETRELIQAHFQQQQGNGYDFAYRYPAMNRVIQSAGRLIRSEQDKGLLILADDRFTRPETRQLMPDHWQPKITSTLHQLQQAMGDFLESDV